MDEFVFIVLYDEEIHSLLKAIKLYIKFVHRKTMGNVFSTYHYYREYTGTITTRSEHTHTVGYAYYSIKMTT